MSKVASRFSLFLWVSLFVGGGLYYVHNYIIPLPLGISIYMAYDPNPKRWEAKIEHDKLGDTGAQHEQWMVSRGGSLKESRYWQRRLWDDWAKNLGIGGMASMAVLGAGFLFLLALIPYLMFSKSSRGRSRRRSSRRYRYS